jgi:hypothetical protein
MTHFSSIVLARWTFAASAGKWLCLSATLYRTLSNSATQSPSPFAWLCQPTLTHRLSIVVGCGARPASRSLWLGPSSSSRLLIRTSRCSLSNHFAPRSSSCWQNWSSASWSGLRCGGGHRIQTEKVKVECRHMLEGDQSAAWRPSQEPNAVLSKGGTRYWRLASGLHAG